MDELFVGAVVKIRRESSERGAERFWVVVTEVREDGSALARVENDTVLPGVPRYGEIIEMAPDEELFDVEPVPCGNDKPMVH